MRKEYFELLRSHFGSHSAVARKALKITPRCYRLWRRDPESIPEPEKQLIELIVKSRLLASTG